ncbi:5-dehydro-4-deoxyglucarate dehydratase [Nocardia sp. CA2R105]|uniref:5-dehydro-4-deoxyglucarate dehydratase n=1 Tax=Nocardia coffeae TaxID=2873381 RepID=UPI001CA69429|nr:5-dehydro-4-deoxyglucarate dehydratase [Nocardia coffeae]MBY8857906.1 5-dehydro-4-deoxyglucarate dehydratase [Nocardia coffeae]
MSQISAEDLGPALGRGLLSFPVTHFDDALAFDEAAYREHIGWLAQYDVAGLFAAGGTGEGFSLTTAEIDQVVRAAVAETEGRVPVIAPATAGTAVAVEQVRNAEAAGAQGILLLPPYLTEAGPDGLVEHVAAVCAATSLGVIFYSRANARIDDVTVARMAERCPNLVGFKDGVGNIETMTRIYARMGDRLTYIGGLPTAETFALPYIEMGVTTYSSAIFNFAPEFALEFYQAVRAHDRDEVYRRLRTFVLPYLDIRDRRPGYAVSIIKAGLTAVGRPSSRVRPPLTDLAADEVAELTELVKSIA